VPVPVVRFKKNPEWNAQQRGTGRILLSPSSPSTPSHNPLWRDVIASEKGLPGTATKEKGNKSKSQGTHMGENVEADEKKKRYEGWIDQKRVTWFLGLAMGWGRWITAGKNVKDDAILNHAGALAVPAFQQPRVRTEILTHLWNKSEIIAFEAQNLHVCGRLLRQGDRSWFMPFKLLQKKILPGLRACMMCRATPHTTECHVGPKGAVKDTIAPPKVHPKRMPM
jgi:hypothetical protein